VRIGAENPGLDQPDTAHHLLHDQGSISFGIVEVTQFAKLKPDTPDRVQGRTGLLKYHRHSPTAKAETFRLGNLEKINVVEQDL